MGHQWPGADSPENSDDNTSSAGGDRGERDYRRPPGNDWTSWARPSRRRPRPPRRRSPAVARRDLRLCNRPAASDAARPAGAPR